MLASRILALNKSQSDSGKIILYVMSRDQRVRDNHALLAAQQDAARRGLPMAVVFNLLPKTGYRSQEQYMFMLEGLKQVQADLAKLNIGFWLTIGEAGSQLRAAFAKLAPAAVYFDFSPLRGPRRLQKSLASELDVPVYVVDTHNIIPLWVLSDKEEFAAHTIRRKVHLQLGTWLAEPEQLVPHTHKSDSVAVADWRAAEDMISSVDVTGASIGFASGEAAARKHLGGFIEKRLDEYAVSRNDPSQDGQSDLSPYLHFGQLSSLRVALELLHQTSNEPPLLLREPRLASASEPHTRMDGVNAIFEEMIVRKELADNFCFYNPNYDDLSGAKPWALQSLDAHRNDPRDHLYSRDQWEQAATHDEAWNAAQLQMMRTGKMHGYMRMYWAKKLLEWSVSPEEAVTTAVYLNDKYSIDGGDPNGYVGVLWSIAGIHDRPWFERSVYGKIRYMNSSGLARKFDLASYVVQYH